MREVWASIQVPTTFLKPQAFFSKVCVVKARLARRAISCITIVMAPLAGMLEKAKVADLRALSARAATITRRQLQMGPGRFSITHHLAQRVGESVRKLSMFDENVRPREDLLSAM